MRIIGGFEMNKDSEGVSRDIETSGPPEISIVIPMYNEDQVVDELYTRLKKVIVRMGRSYEIVFVEDGSKDQTFRKLLEIQEKDPLVKVVKLRANFGQTAALAAGFDQATGNILLAMDGDLQHFPEDIPKFILKIDEGYDIASGWREDRKDPFLSRRLPSKIANWLMAKLSGIMLHDFGTTFKAYRREIIKSIHLYGQFHRFIPVLVSSLKPKIVEIPIQNVRQQNRKSHYNITRTFTVFFDIFRLNFLNKYLSRPLQVFGSLGILLNLLGVGIFLYLVYMKYVHSLGLMNYRAPLFIVSIFIILIGTMFIVLGLLGEMIFKLIHDFNPRQVYAIERIYKHNKKDDNAQTPSAYGGTDSIPWK
jgi:glycosyltransferase involved in cell wall biosynthesis